jgi:hypothetical protein
MYLQKQPTSINFRSHYENKGTQQRDFFLRFLQEWTPSKPLSRYLKGQCHEMDIFFKFKHFNQYFLCMRCWFSRSFKSFSLPYTIINFLFPSLKLLTYFKMLTGTLLIIAFSVIGQCSPVSTPHWMQEKCARINLSLAASGMILQNQRRLPVCIFKCQNRCFWAFEEGITERIIKII